MVSPEQPQFIMTAKGHVNIQATHSSTIEVTMDSHLTMQGDCIIGVNASHSARHLNTLFGDVLRRPDTQIQTYLSLGDKTEQIRGYGSPAFTLTSPTSLVWRTSDFVDNRTIAIRCDKAAKDLDRKLIASLRNPNIVLQVAFVVHTGVK